MLLPNADSFENELLSEWVYDQPEEPLLSVENRNHLHKDTA